MATVQSYTKSGVDAKFNSRSNMTMVHNGGGSPDISAYPDAKTGDVIERSSDGARWGVVASTINPIPGRVVSVAGKTGVVTLGPGDVGASPAGHTHTKAQITDLNASTSATANSMAQRGTGGVLAVGTPTVNVHAATKAYVDSRVSGGITWANLSGKPTTFTPSSHNHTIANITDLTVRSGNVANTVPTRDSNGRFSVANPSASLEVANKGYVDGAVSSGTTWANTSGKPTTFPPSSHNHTVAQITDMELSDHAKADSVVQRSDGGQVRVPLLPMWAEDATSKQYVDNTVSAGATWSSLAGKPSTFPPSTHTHTVGQVSGLTLAVPATASTTPLRGTDGTITTATPTLATHAATKKYVDDKVATPVTWASLSGKPTTFTPSSHNHTVAHITDLTLSVNPTANTVVKRSDTRQVRLPLVPVWAEDAASKSYVDAQDTATKAWSAITDKPSTFPPSTHSHTQAQVTGLPAKLTTYDSAVSRLNASRSDVSGSSTHSGVLLSLSGLGRLTAVDPLHTNDVTNKRYVDGQIASKNTWGNTSGKPSTFPPSSHTHTVAQITDLTLSQTATGSTVVQRDSSGRATVATPSSTGHATTKAYVDNAITAAKKWANLTGKPSTFPPSSHNHTVGQITDLTLSTNPTADTVAKRSDRGQVRVALTPAWAEDATSKQYVDGQVGDLQPWVGTQAQYDALTSKSSARLYIIR